MVKSKNYEKEILDHVIDIKEDVAGIKEHLKQLNSKVATNVINIEKNRIDNDLSYSDLHKRLNRIDLTMAKWLGAISVLAVVINVIISKYLL